LVIVFLLLGVIGLKLAYVSDNTVIVAQSINDINSSFFNLELENRIEFIEYYKEKLSPEATQANPTFVDRIKRISISTLTEEIIRWIFDYLEDFAYHDTDAGGSDTHGESSNEQTRPNPEVHQAENPGVPVRGLRVPRDEGERQAFFKQMAQRIYTMPLEQQGQIILDVPQEYWREFVAEIHQYVRGVSERVGAIHRMPQDQAIRFLNELSLAERQQRMEEIY
jgi:hypothetical protein